MTGNFLTMTRWIHPGETSNVGHVLCRDFYLSFHRRIHVKFYYKMYVTIFSRIYFGGVRAVSTLKDNMREYEKSKR